MGFDKLINSWTVIFPLAVLLYYFFRKKYEREIISSTLFWEQSMQEVKVSPYIKKLQQNALFYLQMLALFLFLFILLGPYILQDKEQNQPLILVVDTSASMLAKKDEVTLFQQHQQTMKDLVNERNGQPVTIVLTGKEPKVIINEELNTDNVIKEINHLTVAYEHESIDRAIAFTQSLAFDTNADVHIFTDSLEQSLLPEAGETISWTVHSAEEDFENISIDKFGAIQRGNHIEAIVKITNSAEQKMGGELRLFNELTNEVYVNEAFTVEGNEDILLSYKELPAITVLSAEIIVDDEYEADNFAHMILGEDISRVLIDSDMHVLVKRSFEAMGLAVSTGEASDLEDRQEQTLIVTNDVTQLERKQPVLLIGRNDREAVPVAGQVKTNTDSLFSITDLTEVYISEAYPGFSSYTTIATVGETPLIQKSSEGHIVILADVEMTDWPLHASFPLFMWSVLESQHATENSLGIFRPNELRTILNSGTSDELEIYTMNNEYVKTISDPTNFTAPNRPGIYRALDGKSERLFVVQLEEEEKKLNKGKSIHIARAGEKEDSKTTKNHIGKYFILPILLLLLIEWEVQRRRGYPN